MSEEYRELQAKQRSLNNKAESAQSIFDKNTERYELAKRMLQKESADVEKMQAESLSAFLKRLLGNYDKKLDQEMQEQLAAKRELDLASALLMEAREDLDEIHTAIQMTANRSSYLKERLFKEDAAFREKISGEETKKAELQQQFIELEEALAAGERVLDGIDYALDDLDSADSFSTWDMFTDSSLIFDMMKYDKINKAEDKMTQLERLLQHYSKELKDISLDDELSYENFSGMNKTFDIFFDNLFSDWDTKKKIGRNIEMLENLGQKMEELQRKLENEKAIVAKQIKEI